MDWKAELLKLTRSNYVDQAKYYLNGFWKNGGAEAEAETIWKVTHKFIELDPKKAEGCELDEFQAHKALEAFGETLTVIQLRERLRKIDADANGKMALLEYLAFKYAKTIQSVIESPQGDNSAELKKAADSLQQVQKALDDVTKQLEQQKQALADQQTAEQNAKLALEAQTKAEEEVRKAEVEQKAALDELNAQEAAYQGQIKALEDKTKDQSLSVVQRNKAANELAQVKGQDPLPLRKAKTSQEATVRKVEKERKAAEAATAKAVEAAANAEAKTKQLEEQTKRVEEAQKEAESRCAQAAKLVDDVKKKGGAALGAIWWMEREIKEAQKYLPKKKQVK